MLILPKIVDESFVNHWKDETFTNEMHHSHFESVSSSGLKLLADSPYRFFSNLKDSQNGNSKEPTKSMHFGTLVHKAILEPEEFRKLVVLSPKFDLRKNSDKQAKEEFEKSLNKDAMICTEKEYEGIMGVIDAILNHPVAKNLFTNGVTERSGFYRDPTTGILCRIRPDFMATKNNMLMFFDLKTAVSSEYYAFSKQAWNLGYPIQLAMYREGIKQIEGYYPEVSGFVVVENSKPFEVAIYTLDEIAMQTGEKWYRYCLNKLDHCMRTNNFHQRQKQAENLILPDYALNKPIPEIDIYE